MRCRPGWRRWGINAMSLLVGDIGGTRVRLRLLESGRAGAAVLREMRRPSSRFDRLEDAVAHCLAELPAGQRDSIDGACLAVAGSVRDGRVRFTNLAWETDAQRLARALDLPRVRLVNDLAALASGLDAVEPEALITIRPGTPAGERRLVVSVGTGLGVAAWLGPQVGAVDSEGGHVDFGPGDEMQAALWRTLRARHGHVSYERVLSGQGLACIYEFACMERGARPAERYADDGHRPAAVVALAGEGDADALATIELFASVLGAFAGNVALHWLAAGGVYLAGGVLMHLASCLGDGAFDRAFADKGRMSGLLADVPVSLITADDVGLVGAAALGASDA